MSVGQITDHDCLVIPDPDFAIFRIVALVTWLALALAVVIHNVYTSLTDFIFLPFAASSMSFLAQ
jgi:hypothetical protein